MSDGATPVGSLSTTVAVVEALRALDGAGVSEVADRLDIPTSTAFDHLRSLEDHEFVVKRDGEYAIGTRFLEIGGHARSNRELYRIADPEIQKLANETGEHANLMIEEFGRGTFLSLAKGEDAFELDTHVGKRVELSTTALGKAILASMADERVEAVVEEHGLPAITGRTITDRDRLREELAAIRECGYAVDDEERIRGVRCVAAPIEAESVLAAVSVSGPRSGLQGERFEETVPELVRRAANVTEVNLEYG